MNGLSCVIFADLLYIHEMFDGLSIQGAGSCSSFISFVARKVTCSVEHVYLVSSLSLLDLCIPSFRQLHRWTTQRQNPQSLISPTSPLGLLFPSYWRHFLLALCILIHSHSTIRSNKNAPASQSVSQVVFRIPIPNFLFARKIKAFRLFPQDKRVAFRVHY
ncbi:hypothetical protein P175DRAFT_0297580 [Aspergillus ochraceoroseus IBT 24754]|uniref:Uncharacterized protein n=1 Tax=Aspergillus ochraceoroseus IBT 24754 TaxID=1392256 RepID=A0A2T5LSQ0_9EURO|nr:uncharacterized protein P175DRAFT_0297580 [Aspergillus ochraceoroseus IBT 24754]PTU19309.1 hypothetical protein P175DRAFT_0297580 [Aspergillus ochraceoroseus IBT 24754]